LSGASAATIAEQIKRSEAAVRKRAARLKIVVAKQKANGEITHLQRHGNIGLGALLSA